MGGQFGLEIGEPNGKLGFALWNEIFSHKIVFLIEH
jgi:hypothetical protein